MLHHRSWTALRSCFLPTRFRSVHTRMNRYRSAPCAFPLFLLVGVLLAGCGDNSSPSEPATGPVPEDTTPQDLIIRYIQRLPELDYAWGSENPARDGWPTPGSQVQWQAHVLNRMPDAHEGVGYRWTLDGVAVDSGQVDLPAEGEATVAYPWTWTFDRHTLRFEIDPANEVDEETRNDTLTIFTDALSVGFYVEQTFYDRFAAHQAALGIGSTSFEDWAQRQIRRYNDMFEAAVYPETPNGVLDRYRLDKITLVADSALPLVPVSDTLTNFSLEQAVPNLDDRTVDIQWGFPSALAYVYSDFTSRSTNNQFYYSGFLQHEMGHARYLFDLYSLNVYDGTSGSRVDIMEDDVRVAGSEYMPGSRIDFNGQEGRLLYAAPKGLMNGQWTYIDRHSAGALNRIAGQRATRGNYNCPENCAVYLDDLPAENRLTVSALGEPLGGASVRVYRSHRNPASDVRPGDYQKYYDNIPDMELVADDRGRVLLGHDPFSGGEGIVSVDDLSNGTIILRVEYDGQVAYGFLDVTPFNEAYWRGETDLADYTLNLTLR